MKVLLDRWVEQLVAAHRQDLDDVIYALDNDGAVWMLLRGQNWVQLPSLPQGEYELP